MTDKETMKLALDAIKSGDGWLLSDVITALKERLAQPEQEPAGYVYSELGVKSAAIQIDLPNGTPLYTHPPQRKPLTDEQISDLWCEVSNTDFVTADTHVFARAIEAAHGIKENT